jgi:rubredoxin
VAAAEAFTAGDESSNDEEVEDEGAEEETSSEESASTKPCPICSTFVNMDSMNCSTCGYTFE